MSLQSGGVSTGEFKPTRKKHTNCGRRLWRESHFPIFKLLKVRNTPNDLRRVFLGREEFIVIVLCTPGIGNWAKEGHLPNRSFAFN